MAVDAANGGLIPWQAGMATRIGRFQFVLGREVGVSFYGLNTPKDAIFVPNANGAVAVVQYKSTQFDFPILEYRPFRTFSLDQSSSFMVQLTGGFDIPHNVTLIAPTDTPVPDLRTVWQVGFRILFNWRHYLN